MGSLWFILWNDGIVVRLRSHEPLFPLIASLQLLSVRFTPFYSIFLTKNYLKPRIGGIPALIER